MNVLVTLCALLDDRLAAEEQQRHAVSLLAGGAAFEAWLAFEARLVTEQNRAALGLAGEIRDAGRSPVPRYWTANEYRKIDFYIGDVGESGLEDVSHLALEFKLIHNNKNWKAKAEGVGEDLFPTGDAKSKIRPKLGRHAIVGVVGKVYRDPVAEDYPGQVDELGRWEQELDAYLLPQAGRRGKRAVRTWKGRRFEIGDPRLLAGARNFFQLQLLEGQDADRIR